MEITAGAEAPNKVNVLIEIPKGGNIKYEYNEKTGMIFVDRILHTSMVYPYNYGFIPGTLGEDKDPLDAMVVSTGSFMPNTIIVARPIGLLLMKDEEGVDTKIICVPSEKIDPTFGGVKEIDALDTSIKNMISHFFSYYKSLEPGKWAEVGGWEGRAKAHAHIEASIKRAARE